MKSNSFPQENFRLSPARAVDSGYLQRPHCFQTGWIPSLWLPRKYIKYVPWGLKMAHRTQGCLTTSVNEVLVHLCWIAHHGHQEAGITAGICGKGEVALSEHESQE